MDPLFKSFEPASEIAIFGNNSLFDNDHPTSKQTHNYLHSSDPCESLISARAGAPQLLPKFFNRYLNT